MERDKIANLEASQEISNMGGKYLTFELDREEYGIAILKIKEIIGMMPITALPQSPSFIKGVINLRGKVIPVTDLRLKFSLETAAYTDRTCIIVVEIQHGNSSLLMGLVVDAVSEVANIRGEEIERTPEFGARLRTDYIQGMAKISGGVKILLNIDSVLTGEQMAGLENYH